MVDDRGTCRDSRKRPWITPPDGVVPGFVDVSLPLARNNVLAAQLAAFRVWPQMFKFTLYVWVNSALYSDLTGEGVQPEFTPYHQTDPSERPRLLEIGVVFPDGSSGSNLTQPQQLFPDPDGGLDRWAELEAQLLLDAADRRTGRGWRDD